MIKRSKAENSEAMTAGNYEAKVAEIETIITRIETGELELEQVFAQFSTAVEYLRQCENFLQQRQQQVDLLIETLSDD
ncbi:MULTISPECIES: exodeoxyribonuclease VII small subunit [Calothrix]|uniref:Exodeoxyribonuclease 7 small subunit n=2 Tax=Calothrix TaxID=1186 RepID=A0ABR8AFD9_9CYAN|nr:MULTISPECIES: exodeoxyribonuclease VII small subunit [Calothrix]MBD2198762.1 exodeoxyribonuclease VII small subunit [Calothrix parietina FACHB-288]MBD2228590.1 exodeoxyribonuclease VII small subunit [Calothrix anomala FACHB-343]